MSCQSLSEWFLIVACMATLGTPGGRGRLLQASKLRALDALTHACMVLHTWLVVDRQALLRLVARVPRNRRRQRMRRLAATLLSRAVIEIMAQNIISKRLPDTFIDFAIRRHCSKLLAGIIFGAIL